MNKYIESIVERFAPKVEKKKRSRLVYSRLFGVDGNNGVVSTTNRGIHADLGALENLANSGEQVESDDKIE